MGTRRGLANACIPFKVPWIIRTSFLRRLFKKMHDQKKIDKHIWHSLYVITKGYQFKNKRVLLESIHELKAVSIDGNYPFSVTTEYW